MWIRQSISTCCLVTSADDQYWWIAHMSLMEQWCNLCCLESSSSVWDLYSRSSIQESSNMQDHKVPSWVVL